MPKFKIDISKYHIFIYKPSNSYVIVERNTDPVFAKLMVIYDYNFARISDRHFTEVQFLDYDKEINSYQNKSDNLQSLKVNDLMNLPYKTKLLLKIHKLLGL